MVYFALEGVCSAASRRGRAPALVVKGDSQVKVVFDIGMFDGADSRYFLDDGFRVVAVEANPDLVERARRRFAKELASGQLVIVDAAIAEEPGEIELSVCADDLGSSSLYKDTISHRGIARTFKVRATTLGELMREHGTPHHLNVDIEGADRLCVLALERARRPEYRRPSRRNVETRRHARDGVRP